MLLAPKLGAPPREIAERLGEALSERLGERVEKVEVAGPGFVNVYLSDAWYTAAAAHVLAAGDWGAGTAAERERIVVEFVSANPTGPITAASGRHAAYGDALARLLEFAGHDVSREYYFNDAGGQLIRLGESIRARARGEAVPEDGYPGEYVAELADRIENAAERDAEDLAFAGGQLMIERIKETLERFGVHFDTWFSERSLHDGAIEHALERVEKAGHAYRSEGALWLRTTDFGDDQDRVIVRSTGAPTYFAADVAYVENKVERGFERQITPLGADHHGYVPRFKAALAVLGGDPDKLEIPLLQFVHIVERGQRASMSKRRGEFVTLDELVDQIGVDATRYFLLQRSNDSTIDLDLAARDRGVGREPRLLRPVRARADRLDPAQGRARAGRRRPLAASLRARADQEAARLPGRGRGGGRAPGAAPDRRLRARAGPDLHGVLPRLQGGRGARARRGVQARPVRGLPAHPRPLARAARGLRPRQHVALQLVEEVQPEAVERLLGLDVERRQLAGEEQDAHGDQHGAGERR